MLRAGLVLCAALVGCAGSGGHDLADATDGGAVSAGDGDVIVEDGDGGTRPVPPQCVGLQPLVIGHCELEGSLAYCNGIPNEHRVFAPYADGDSVPIIFGNQGLFMFVLALGATGIDPGDPSRPADLSAPRVDVRVVTASTGETVAEVRQRKAGYATPDGLAWVPGLYVVIGAEASELEGQTLEALAKIEDKNGERRCGGLRFRAVKAPE